MKMEKAPVGVAFLTIGKNAIPALLKLLDYKEKYPLFFIGSEEATIGTMRRLRREDFAAWFIGRILGKHLKYYPDFESRDKQIEELKHF